MKRIIILIILIYSVVLFGDGFVVIPPTPFLPNPEQVAVKYHKVDIKIGNQIAEVHIDQVFRNPNNIEVEGRYIFPIPEEASISDFVLYIDGEKVHGEIQGAEEALRIYQNIVSQMIDPAILRYVGQDMFEARIYPFPAKGERRVEIDYEQLVTKDGNLYRFIYPLSTEQFSSEDLESAVISILLTSDKPIKNVYSPSHEIEVIYKNSKEVEISWEERDIKPDKDFVIYYSLAEEEVDISLLTYKPHRSEDGYFMLLASVGSDNLVTIPKDVVFVIDRSGSMRGERIENVKKSLTYCINNLGKEDRFNIISFSSGTENLFTGLNRVNRENIEEALDFVDNINARGGTNISKSLEEAYRSNFSKSRPSFIIFMTDGYPTVGVIDPGLIVNQVADYNESRLFVFGFGSEDINAILLDAMAESGRGLVEYIKSGDSIELSVGNFFDKVSHPVLTNLNINFGNTRVYDIVPQIYPDIFEGQQLVITGRYRNSGRSLIYLTGNREEEKAEYSISVSFPKHDNDLDFIGRYWAMRQVGTLLKEIRLHGENQELVDEVKELGLEFGIITPYTSYLVVEDISTKPMFSYDSRTLRGASGMGGSVNFAPDITEAEASGEYSIDISTTVNRMSEGNIREIEVNPIINYINGKAFNKKRGIWQESTYEDQSFIEIEYGSSEFFDLLMDDSDIGNFMSLGSVIFEYKGKWYKIIK